MEWTKIPTSLIINRTSDKELLAITKYQLLWAELEYQPDDAVALRYMTRNQLTTARQYIDSITAQVCADINSVENIRKRQKKNYLKNKENLKNLTVRQTGSLTGTVTGSLSKQIRLDKIRLDNINNTSTPAVARVEEFSKPKKRTALQVFCNCVVADFEKNVKTNEQKRIWFKRNCRCLTDILSFCDKDIERAMFAIDETCKWLEENNLEGGYEAVLRNIAEMDSRALRRINKGERWPFKPEQQAQIEELYGKKENTISDKEAKENRKALQDMLGEIGR